MRAANPERASLMSVEEPTEPVQQSAIEIYKGQMFTLERGYYVVLVLHNNPIDMLGRHTKLKPQEISWMASVLLRLGQDTSTDSHPETRLGLLQSSLQGALTLLSNGGPQVRK